jgi:bifunctional ADP-heptose synthase (sugar kinase/adenylyltransferase)
LLALRCVEYVTIFEQPTAEALVAAVQPEIYVKGGDYQHHDPTDSPADSPASPDTSPPIDEARLPEARVVRSYGGQVRLLPYQAGHSTSALIERIVRLYHARHAQDTT